MSVQPMSLAELATKKNVRNLFQTIVHSGVCSGCASCVISCPVAALGYSVDRPVLLDNCIDCMLCSNACPRLDFSTEAVRGAVFPAPSEPDFFVQGAGTYRRLAAARGVAPNVRAAAQDGGLITALLTWAFHRDLIDGAVVSRRSRETWQPQPTVVTTAKDLLACAGSAYTYCSNELALREAAKKGLTRLAFVGTGCQISGLRQLQTAKSKKLRAIFEPIKLTIGLLCSESFDYEPFIRQQIEQGLGVSVSDVAKVNIKGRVLVHMRSGEVLSIPLKNVRPFARQGCHYCRDFAAEYADISAGGLGMDGWTMATLRTEVAEYYLDGAVADGFVQTQAATDFPAALDLYSKLATKQRERPHRAESPGESA